MRLSLLLGACFSPDKARTLLDEIRTYSMDRLIYGPAGLAYAIADVIAHGCPDTTLRNLLHACARLSRAAVRCGVGPCEEAALYGTLARITFGALRYRWHARTARLPDDLLPSWDERAPIF